MPDNFKPLMGSGDNGISELAGGKKAKKTDSRFYAMALTDELSAQLGLVKAKSKAKKFRIELEFIQTNLLKAGAQIAGLNFTEELAAAAKSLETEIGLLSTTYKPEKQFVLAGKNETEALLHLCRAKARLCELALWQIKSRHAAIYLNRLSDYLFLLAISSK